MKTEPRSFLNMPPQTEGLKSGKAGMSFGMILAVLALTLFTVALGLRIYIL